jgi:hypothetical protein
MQDFIRFNPRPSIDALEWSNGQTCYVIDDALLEPQRLVDFALVNRAQFSSVDFNAYPGLLLPSPPAISIALNDFFTQHVRRYFDARRVTHMHSRLAMVTLPASELRPYQWICHRDDVGLGPDLSMQASVLYLFHDESFGGTSFYEPNLAPAQMASLAHEAGTLSNAAFAQKYGIEPGYLCDSNRYFTRVGSVRAKWNRIIFYDGGTLHSGDIEAPEKLSADPATGRLSLNGFFTSRRRAG